MLAEERGASLLEVLIALSILAIAGMASAIAVTESFHAAATARERDLEMREALRLMEAVQLWSRKDLELHLGDRRQGPFRLQLERPFPGLYGATLTDSLGTELLRTSLFRPEPIAN